MSVVAVRDGVMAADTFGQFGDIQRFARKLYRADHAIIGFTGNLSDGLTFVDWWAKGHDLGDVPEFRTYRGNEDAPDIYALVLTTGGLEVWSEHFQPNAVEEMPYFAIGAGAPFALGAMWMGATAVEAAEAACAACASCALPVIHEVL